MYVSFIDDTRDKESHAREIRDLSTRISIHSRTNTDNDCPPHEAWMDDQDSWMAPKKVKPSFVTIFDSCPWVDGMGKSMVDMRCLSRDVRRPWVSSLPVLRETSDPEPHTTRLWKRPSSGSPPPTHSGSSSSNPHHQHHQDSEGK